MLENTHIRIAEEIAKELNLGKTETDLLKMGSTRPDSFEEFPHHHGKESLIFKKILDARALYLKGDDEAFVKLGEAMHYIADGWTLRPSVSEKHTQWEFEIDKCRIESDEEFRETISRANIPSKEKRFYLECIEVFKELYRRDDFTDLKPCLFESDLQLFLLSEIDESEEDESEEAGYAPYIVCYPGGRLLPALIWRNLGYQRKYSTPSIDLNIAFRVCLGISRLVLTRDITLPKSKWSLDWNSLPLNWGKKSWEKWDNKKSEEERQEIETEIEEEIRRIEGLPWWKKGANEREELRKLKMKKELLRKGYSPREADSIIKEEEEREKWQCFIATAAYGSEIANEVTVLRRFRDAHLLKSNLGKKFVFAYYEVSPPIAEFIAKHQFCRLLVRVFLHPLIAIAKIIVRG